jgi:hypothetical protein
VKEQQDLEILVMHGEPVQAAEHETQAEFREGSGVATRSRTTLPGLIGVDESLVPARYVLSGRAGVRLRAYADRALTEGGSGSDRSAATDIWRVSGQIRRPRDLVEFGRSELPYIEPRGSSQLGSHRRDR